MTTTLSTRHAALRKGRYSVSGQTYLVTFTTCRRAPHFATADVAMAAARAITDARLWENAQLLTWVLMPDHWHSLIALGDGECLSKVVQRLKANSARQARKIQPGIRVWGKAYHDRALREEEAVIDAARYMVMNPVRAGLVRSVGRYPYWDAVWV